MTNSIIAFVRQVPPSGPVENSSYGSYWTTKFFGDLFWRVTFGLHFQHLFDVRFCQFGLTIIRPSIRCAITDFVLLVFLVGAPTNIPQSIVPSSAVEVSAFFTYETGANKSSQNDLVNQHRFIPTIFPEADINVTVTAMFSRIEDLFCDSHFSTIFANHKPWKGFYSPKIGNTVTTPEVRNITPVFPGAVGMDLDLLPELFFSRIVVHGPTSNRAMLTERVTHSPSSVNSTYSSIFRQIQNGGVLCN